MLKVLLGSKDKELVLQYLISKNEGYASKIARFFSLNPSQITKQLEFLENGDILVGIQVGRARFYKFNPKYYFLDELKALLIKARDAYRILKILKTNLCTTERLLVNTSSDTKYTHTSICFNSKYHETG